jgi:hypothetical protein
MKARLAEVIRFSPGKVRVFLDGQQIPGVRSASVTERLREVPTLTLELLAHRIEYRDATPEEQVMRDSDQ